MARGPRALLQRCARGWGRGPQPFPVRGAPTPQRPSIPVCSPGLQPLESQHLGGEAVEAPLDGRAAAKLLQDGPDVVQVAGGSQPHGERDALWGRGPGSLTWAGGLSEGTGHLPPTSLGGHTRLSPALWGRLFMGAGGEGGVGGEVTLWSPATAASPSPGLAAPRQSREGGSRRQGRGHSCDGLGVGPGSGLGV